MIESTGKLRWQQRGEKLVLQQQVGVRNNWAWGRLQWVDVPTVDEEGKPIEGGQHD